MGASKVSVLYIYIDNNTLSNPQKSGLIIVTSSHCLDNR